MHKDSQNKTEDVIGLMPAAGLAKRLGLNSGSKEMLVVPQARPEDPAEADFKPVSQLLLENFAHSGIQKVFVILRAGKWDIPEYYEDGSKFGVHISYILTRFFYGPPYSLDAAYPHFEKNTVALGFPDIIFNESDAYRKILDKLSSDQCDLVLGLFPANRPDKVDMVELDPDGRVKRIDIKPGSSNLRLTWGIAVWRPVFSRFMHTLLAQKLRTHTDLEDVHIGNIIQAAIENGMDIRATIVANKPYLDIGTPEDLETARAGFPGPETIGL